MLAAIRYEGLKSNAGLWRFPLQLLLNTLPDLEAAIWHTAEDGENKFIFINVLKLGILEVIK